MFPLRIESLESRRMMAADAIQVIDDWISQVPNSVDFHYVKDRHLETHDLNGDGDLTSEDVKLFVESQGCKMGDFDGDGDVDGHDVAKVYDPWSGTAYTRKYSGGRMDFAYEYPADRDNYVRDAYFAEQGTEPRRLGTEGAIKGWWGRPVGDLNADF